VQGGFHVSQIFDYFVCERGLIERWADALEQRNEALQQKFEAEMPRFITLKNVGQQEFGMLARCAAGKDTDSGNAVGGVDLVKAFSEEGPWLLAFRPPAVERLANMIVEESLIEKWLAAVTEFTGGDSDHLRKFLTVIAANDLKGLCDFAIKNKLGVFTCLYG
jgi:hypothetical protein